MRQRFSQTLIYSGIAINSFNPSHVSLTFNINMIETSILLIRDNNATILQLSNPAEIPTTSIILPDGFHRLDILFIDQKESIEVTQTIEMASGTQSLQVTVLDENHKPVENVSVHLALVDYSHITLKHLTNHLGEVTFHNVPKHTRLSIEAVCTKSRLYAYTEVDTQDSRNINLILKDRSVVYDEGYNLSDK